MIVSIPCPRPEDDILSDPQSPNEWLRHVIIIIGNSFKRRQYLGESRMKKRREFVFKELFQLVSDFDKVVLATGVPVLQDKDFIKTCESVIEMLVEVGVKHLSKG